MNLGCSGVNEPMRLGVGSRRSKGAGSGYLPWGQRTQQNNFSFVLCFSSQLNQALGWKGYWSLHVCLPPLPAGGLLPESGWLTEDPKVPARPFWAPPPSSSPPFRCSGSLPLIPQHGAVFLAATDYGKASMVWDLFSKIGRREIILMGKQNKPKQKQ